MDTESSFPKPDQGKDADSHYYLYTIILGVTTKEEGRKKKRTGTQVGKGEMKLSFIAGMTIYAENLNLPTKTLLELT